MQPVAEGARDVDHEHVVARRGERSGATIIVALHSTARGPALGGCRVWRYPRWHDALDDVLRLAAGMTDKAAVAGLPFGGGKAVVALPPASSTPALDRRGMLLDVGDVVASLDGRYVTGPDVGTGTDDMAVIAERTGHVLCTPAGSGDSSPATATATLACLERTVARLDGRTGLAGAGVTVVGLGHVGGHLVRGLVRGGAEVSVTDVDPGRRAQAHALGAAWIDPADALGAPTDVLVPAALGVGLDVADVRSLRCAAVVGPANAQLADEAVADALHEHGVLWAPDYLVGAGGIVHATAIERDHAGPAEARRRVRGLADTWQAILDQAHGEGVSPHHVARRLVRDRLDAASR